MLTIRCHKQTDHATEVIDACKVALDNATVSSKRASRCRSDKVRSHRSVGTFTLTYRASGNESCRDKFAEAMFMLQLALHTYNVTLGVTCFSRIDALLACAAHAAPFGACAVCFWNMCLFFGLIACAKGLQRKSIMRNPLTQLLALFAQPIDAASCAL